MSGNKTIIPLPFYFYFWAVFLIALTGLLSSVYLFISHYRVYTDIGYQSFCAISRAINCDTVSQSPYSIFFNVPIPIWGVIGYLFVLVLLFISRSKQPGRERVWALMFWVSLVYSFCSVVLTMLSTYLIRSYCIMCIVTYGVNLALLWYAWLIRKRFSLRTLMEDTKEDVAYLRRDWSRNLWYLAPFPILIVLTLSFFPPYWNFEPPAMASQINSGITSDGHPWIGAENPLFEITEFSDYQCFQCKKMHFFIRRLIADNPGKIRLVHRHYPMDHEFNPIVKKPFHVGSGAMALLAIYATTQDEFWDMNDLLYEMAGNKRDIGLREVAAKSGLEINELRQALRSSSTIQKLNQDLVSGIKLGLTGTPGYLINDTLYMGQIPPEIIKAAIKR
jgi:protein-disulfide isomerase/uncharacterized membrane protein